MYYLVDWERTIQSGIVHYWKKNRFGYTFVRESAGLFSEEEAKRIVNDDKDNRTHMLRETFVKEMLKA